MRARGGYLLGQEPTTWLDRRREEFDFLWTTIKTIVYAIARRMW